MGQLVFFDYAIIAVYMLFAVGTGIVFSKRASQSTENYFLGGRSLPWWMIAVSKDKLEVFYRKVRPGGFWDVLGRDVRELPGAALSVSTIIEVTGGIMLCYGISLAIGYSISISASVHRRSFH